MSKATIVTTIVTEVDTETGEAKHISNFASTTDLDEGFIKHVGLSACYSTLEFFKFGKEE